MKLIHTLFITAAALLFFAACKKTDYAEQGRKSGPLSLSASKTTLVLNEAEGAADAVIFNWTTGSNLGTNASIVYTLQIAKQGDNFSNAVTEEVGRGMYTRKYAVMALNELLLQHFNAVPGQEMILEAKVVAQTDAAGITAEESPVVLITVTPYSPVSSTLYMIGDATSHGWDNTAGTPMNVVDGRPGIFTYTGPLFGGELKFITTLGEWLPSYNKGTSETTVLLRTDFGQPDDKWVIPAGGTYTVEIDLLSLTISIQQSALPPYARLWIVGDATPNGWNIDNPNEMQVDSSNLFIFRFNDILTAGEFKIPTATGNWGTDFYMPPANHPDINLTSVQLTPGGNPDNKWQITSPGPYKIRLDLQNLSVSIKPFTPYTQLWLVGDATPAGWNIDHPEPMTATPGNPYQFTWTGAMTPGEFKIPTATGNWGGDFFMPMVNQQGIDGTLAKFVSGGNPDHKWRIALAGNYTITFNQLKETITIVKN